MADKKQLSLKPCTASSRAGASGLQMNGGEVFSPKPYTTVEEEEAFTGEESAPKSEAPTAGPKGCAIKIMKAEEDAAAEKTAVADETLEPEDDSILEKCEARYAQLMDELFGNGPNAVPVRWVKHPSCMYYHGQDDGNEEEELGSADDEKAAMTDETTEQEDDDSDYDKVHEECKARYEALMEKLFGGGAPHVRVVEYHSCMSYDGQDAEEEELDVVVDGIPPEASK
jgi:hypothetical protein